MKRKEEKNKDLKEMSEEKAKDILTLENQSKESKNAGRRNIGNNNELR
jgi:hypothetical protein